MHHVGRNPNLCAAPTLTQVWELAGQLSHDDGVADVLVGVASVLRALPHDDVGGVSPSSDHVVPVRAPCSRRSKMSDDSVAEFTAGLSLILHGEY